MTDLSYRSGRGLTMLIRALDGINRILTWGMPGDDRDQLLNEALADWEAMAEHRGSAAVLARGLRGIPAWIWVRLNQRETSAVPAAAAMTLIAACGFVMATDADSYPATFRFWATAAAAGFLWLAVTLLCNPRRISLRSLRLPGLASSVSVMAMAVAIPSADDWPYAAPMLRSFLTEGALRAGVLTVGIALGVLSVGSFTQHQRGFFRASGAFFVLGILQVAVSQIAWGVWATSVDFTLGGASIGVGLAALSIAHVIPRLRHLELDEGGRT